MIDIRGLTVEYEGGIKALDGVDLVISEGDSLGLIGANGAGKSSLFRSLTGLTAFKGSIMFNGLEVIKKNMPEIRKDIGYVIQESDDQMFMPKVIEDMIFGPVNYGMAKDDAVKKADEILEQLEISHLKDRYNHKISGGEKKMAAIATILMMKPKVILFDEPTSSLDPHNRRTVINAIMEIEATKIVASHDLDLIYDICDKVALLNRGCIVKVGSKDEILRDKKLLEENGLELPLSFSGR
ncbi:MAG: energy-coupling factor ABC transporter ATP-binding protein [Clostridiales bacterium]|nr:energy-coupling factor ABC transporter ATP-binding protein [Clostridiales bacterium]